MKHENLMSGLLNEMNRVRELITQYEALPNGVGIYGATTMKSSIEMAEISMSDGDVIDMLKQYENLKSHN
ncbi:hypothetical protein LCGC14_3149820 [marine sediment metagenome]|uniref:Uncharacterized protein n=1 Tax=marine sediment metagenome TaxID=412755 RepID=A0A0F8YIT1_9ZZZZ